MAKHKLGKVCELFQRRISSKCSKHLKCHSEHHVWPFTGIISYVIHFVSALPLQIDHSHTCIHLGRKVVAPSLWRKMPCFFSKSHNRPGVLKSWLWCCLGYVDVRRGVWEIHFGNETCGTYFDFWFFFFHNYHPSLPGFPNLDTTICRWTAFHKHLTTVCGSVRRPRLAVIYPKCIVKLNL